jgi:DNA-binding transcriptional MocR family regulator
MNAGPTSERVLYALRRAVLGHQFRPGERLDPAVLASEFASSVTPVREALHVLSGEGLAETRTGDGFHVPHIDEPALRDRYRWNLDLVRLATAGRPVPQSASPGIDADPATRTAATMSRIARLSQNAELHRAMASLNARLHSARMLEPVILGDPQVEIVALEAALEANDLTMLRKRMTSYSLRRQRAAAATVRALYQANSEHQIVNSTQMDG